MEKGLKWMNLVSHTDLPQSTCAQSAFALRQWLGRLQCSRGNQPPPCLCKVEPEINGTVALYERGGTNLVGSLGS
jgi:hypothetical protein